MRLKIRKKFSSQKKIVGWKFVIVSWNILEHITVKCNHHYKNNAYLHIHITAYTIFSNLLKIIFYTELHNLCFIKVQNTEILLKTIVLTMIHLARLTVFVFCFFWVGTMLHIRRWMFWNKQWKIYSRKFTGDKCNGREIPPSPHKFLWMEN